MSAGDPTTSEWPGQRLGLPETGPRSIARPGRRLIALSIDWLIAFGLGYAFFEGEALAIALIFVAMQIVFIATLSGSIGHLLLGMRVVPVLPTWIGILKPTVRSVLLILVIPAVIWDRDQRGLHDSIARTILVRR